MRLTLLGVLCAFGLLVLNGCAAWYKAPVMPPVGFIFNDTKAPMDHDSNGMDLGSKSGRAEATSILGLVSTGDCSIGAAAANGQIKTVKHMDYEFFNVLGVFSRFTTRVHGD